MATAGSELVELEVEREPSLRFLLSQVAEARSAKQAAGQVGVAPSHHARGVELCALT